MSPTSALTDEESKNLLNLLRSFRERGVTCIYISHKLSEVFDVSDTVTILRDGRVVASKKTKDLTEDELISLMVRAYDYTALFQRWNITPGGVVFEIKELDGL